MHNNPKRLLYAIWIKETIVDAESHDMLMKMSNV